MITMAGLINHLECDIIQYKCLIAQLKHDNTLDKNMQKNIAECHKQQIVSIREWIVMCQGIDLDHI